MTFQIGMTFNEGVILASDRKIVRTTGIRTGLISSKIDAYPEENIAFCSSGDSFCYDFTDVVREEMRNPKRSDKSISETKSVLIGCLLTARRRHAEARLIEKERTGREPFALQGGNTLIVFKEQSNIQLWSVNTMEMRPDPLPVIDRLVISGDPANAAVFFPNKYFQTAAPMRDSMIRLAVHTVLMAKSDHVEGVEIGIFSKSEFKVLDQSELKAAIEASQKIDSFIRRSFGKPSKR